MARPKSKTKKTKKVVKKVKVQPTSRTFHALAQALTKVKVLNILTINKEHVVDSIAKLANRINTEAAKMENAANRLTAKADRVKAKAKREATRKVKIAAQAKVKVDREAKKVERKKVRAVVVRKNIAKLQAALKKLD